jgi:hypothetical protein
LISDFWNNIHISRDSIGRYYNFNMGDGAYNPSDLNSVLSTLSSLASQGQGSSNQHISTHNRPPRTTSSQSKPSKDPRPPQPRITRPSTTSTSTSDSSTITTWPAALKHVMRTVGQNEETQARIRGVIRSQHHHEQQWFDAREALLKQQQGRPEKQRELDAVLWVYLYATALQCFAVD